MSTHEIVSSADGKQAVSAETRSAFKQSEKSA